jgi:cytochrome oxidase Cu insertion factor (SCO1/SenC/PrrC family)
MSPGPGRTTVAGMGRPSPAPPGAGAPAGPPAAAPSPPRRRGPGRAIGAALGVAAVLAGLFAYLAVRGRAQPGPVSQVRVSGLPADMSTSLANLMQLSPLPGPPAPGFALTDQAGRTLSLASFRGHAVVLEFMDPHCTDICPIVSQEFIDAQRDLGPAARGAVFIAVNVNAYHHGVADVAAFSREHLLTTIPSWHFFTGSVASLEAVWRAYNITVQAPNPNADIVHTSALYFIDPAGRERFLASPMDDHTANGTSYLPPAQLTSWGRGIALVTRHLAG